MFSHYKSMGIFSRAANSAVGSWIWPNFELQVLMHIIIICKYEKDRMKKAKKNGDTVFAIITLFVAIENSGLIWPNFELTQALMYVIITCKYEKDPHQEPIKSGNTVFFFKL